jgi:hypothetical protein
MKIGEKAATWYQEEIKRVRTLLAPESGNGHLGVVVEVASLVEGQLEEMDERTWEKFAASFL